MSSKPIYKSGSEVLAAFFDSSSWTTIFDNTKSPDMAEVVSLNVVLAQSVVDPPPLDFAVDSVGVPMLLTAVDAFDPPPESGKFDYLPFLGVEDHDRTEDSLGITGWRLVIPAGCRLMARSPDSVGFEVTGTVFRYSGAAPEADQSCMKNFIPVSYGPVFRREEGEPHWWRLGKWDCQSGFAVLDWDRNVEPERSMYLDIEYEFFDDDDSDGALGAMAEVVLGVARQYPPENSYYPGYEQMTLYASQLDRTPGIHTLRIPVVLWEGFILSNLQVATALWAPETKFYRSLRLRSIDCVPVVPAQVTIQVRKESDGSPVPGADINFDWGPGNMSILADAGGDVTVPLLPGHYSLNTGFDDGYNWRQGLLEFDVSDPPVDSVQTVVVLDVG
jgi:hypothetical protein